MNLFESVHEFYSVFGAHPPLSFFDKDDKGDPVPAVNVVEEPVESGDKVDIKDPWYKRWKGMLKKRQPPLMHCM